MKKSFLKKFFIYVLLFSFILFSCSSNLVNSSISIVYEEFLNQKELKGSYIKSENLNEEGQVFPENEFIKKFNKKTIAVVFSGGGTRAATCALGELRALNKLKMLDKVSYISSVSGGAWTSLPFTFLPENILDEDFLGEYIEPENLNLKILEKANDLATENISNSKMTKLFFINKMTKDGFFYTYSKVVGSIFLENLNLNKRKLITLNEETFRRFKIKNRILSINDFYIPKKGRPFLIVNSTLRLDKTISEERKIPFEYTPYYVGSRKKSQILSSLDDLSKSDNYVGGIYIPTYSYNSNIINLNNNEFSSKIFKPFSLKDILGSTSAAPEEVVRAFGMRNFIDFPEFYSWTVNDKDAISKVNNYPHGDGGLLENLGLANLLGRKIDNVIVFMNTDVPFSSTKNNNEIITKEMTSLFIKGEEDKNKTINNIIPNFSYNVIFKDGLKKYNELITKNECKV